jgi:general secretion pathway protein D
MRERSRPWVLASLLVALLAASFSRAQAQVIQQPGRPPFPPGGFRPPQGIQQQTGTTATVHQGDVSEVVYLKYADISEVADALVESADIQSNDTFSPQTSNFGTQQFGGTQNNGQPFQQQQNFNNGAGNTQGLGQRVNDNVAVDRRLNAIILTGPPDTVASLKKFIEAIDIPLDSVMFETQIVELDDTGAEDLGINGSPNGIAATMSLTAQSLASSVGNAQFQATLYALIQHGQGKVLSKPSIIAQNGANASILTGDALPIITTVVVAGASAVTSQQVNYVNVGVNLQILPRVASDGYVTSHIFSEVSSVTAYTQGIPQISERQAQTTATVKDGESFVIGGLLEDDELRTVYKVPGLGDIPLIGGLFRYLSTTSTKTNLYIVVTPHIIKQQARTAPTVVPGALPTGPGPGTPGGAPAAGGAVPAPQQTFVPNGTVPVILQPGAQPTGTPSSGGPLPAGATPPPGTVPGTPPPMLPGGATPPPGTVPATPAPVPKPPG